MVRLRDRSAARLDDVPDEYLKKPGTQEETLEMRDVLRAINRLTHIHREALYLLCVDGLSYEEIAEVQGCAVGTIKSRISRARQDMKAILDQDTDPADEDGHDVLMGDARLLTLGAVV